MPKIRNPPLLFANDAIDLAYFARLPKLNVCLNSNSVLSRFRSMLAEPPRRRRALANNDSKCSLDKGILHHDKKRYSLGMSAPRVIARSLRAHPATSLWEAIPCTCEFLANHSSAAVPPSRSQRALQSPFACSPCCRCTNQPGASLGPAQ